MIAKRPTLSCAASALLLAIAGSAQAETITLGARVAEVCQVQLAENSAAQSALTIRLACNVERFTLLVSGVPENIQLIGSQSQAGLISTSLYSSGVQGHFVRPGSDTLVLNFDAALPQDGSIQVTFVPVA